MIYIAEFIKGGNMTEDEKVFNSKNPYIIVSHINALEFQDIVNEKIREHYIPIGGVAIKYGKSFGTVEFFQAMMFKLPAVGVP